MKSATTTYTRTPTVNRDQLILDNVDFVARILSTMTFNVRDEEAKENLHSAGIVGLVQAAHGYDPDQGVAFRTFAYPRVRGAIVDEMRKQSPVSQAVLQNIGRVRKAHDSIEPPVTQEKLAEATGLSIEQVNTCLEAMRFIKPDNWNDLSDVIHGSWRNAPNTPEHDVEREELCRILAEGIESLPEQERIVLTLYFTEELKLAEIGKVINLSESRVSKILTNAKFLLQEIVRCRTS
ncbi:MAG: sigma-70 family RNA polymerase sigma factor [Planctomycetota bacterium]